jgi:hypothetical protein
MKVELGKYAHMRVKSRVGKSEWWNIDIDAVRAGEDYFTITITRLSDVYRVSGYYDRYEYVENEWITKTKSFGISRDDPQCCSTLTGVLDKLEIFIQDALLGSHHWLPPITESDVFVALLSAERTGCD